MSLLSSEAERAAARKVRLINLIVAEEFARRSVCSVAEGQSPEWRLVVEPEGAGEEGVDECICAEYPLLRAVYATLSGRKNWDPRPFEAREAGEPLAVQADDFTVPRDVLVKAFVLRDEVCKARVHYADRDITHRCIGEPEAERDAAYKWDAFEKMRLTLDHLGRNIGEAELEPHWNVDATSHYEITDVSFNEYGDATFTEVWHEGSATPYEVSESESEDWLDYVHREQQAARRAELDASITWSEVRTYTVDKSTLNRKRGRELTPEMRKRNQERTLKAKADAEKQNRALLVGMIRALGADPADPKVVGWVNGCIAKRDGKKARGYGLAIERLKHERGCGVVAA